jgi:quercetin dioxygenase-like cupin family protein
MELITPSKTAKASDSAFTGDVYVNPIKQKAEPSRLIASIVRFTPGARTNWHSHALEGVEDGDGTTWLDPVTDEQYAAADQASPATQA